MIFEKPKIDEVFTPRREEVNPKTYVSRPKHEKELVEALQGSLQPILFGYSGTGKSWLYKKVLSDVGAYMVVVSASSAATLGSLTEEIAKVVFPESRKELNGVSSELFAGLSAASFAKGGAKSTRHYTIVRRDPLLLSYRHLRKKAGNALAVLVIDNLEFLFKHEKLMDELANLIILSDDRRYAKYKIKLLIVGTPSDVVNYFTRVRNLSPVANRLRELTEMKGFTSPQGGQLITTGFNTLLKANIETAILNRLTRHVHKITLGFPQMVHEYCQILAHKMEDNSWLWKEGLKNGTDLDWLRMGLRSSYIIVESLMNKKQSKIGRRNQVLYVLGRMNINYFTARQVEDTVRKEFPQSTSGKQLSIGRILGQLDQRLWV